MLLVVNAPTPIGARNRFKMVLSGHLPLISISGSRDTAVVATSVLKNGSNAGSVWSPTTGHKMIVSSDSAISAEMESSGSQHELHTVEYSCIACSETILAADSDSLDGLKHDNNIIACPACGGRELKTLSTFDALTLLDKPEEEKDKGDTEQGTVTASEQVSNDSTDRRTAKMSRKDKTLAGDGEANMDDVKKMDGDEPVTIEDLDEEDTQPHDEPDGDELGDLGEEVDVDDGEESAADFDLGDDSDAEDDLSDDEIIDDSVDEDTDDTDDDDAEDTDDTDDADDSDLVPEDDEIGEESDDRAQIIPPTNPVTAKTKPTATAKVVNMKKNVKSASDKVAGVTKATAVIAGAPKKITVSNALIAGKALKIETPKPLLISRATLKRAALAASKVSTKTALAYTSVASSVKSFMTTASSNQKLRFDVTGLLAGSCPLCDFHTIASDSITASAIKCQNCGSGIPNLVPVALSADPSEIEDSVNIEMPDSDEQDVEDGEEESNYIPSEDTVSPDEEVMDETEMEESDDDMSLDDSDDEGIDDVPVDTGDGDDPTDLEDDDDMGVEEESGGDGEDCAPKVGDVDGDGVSDEIDDNIEEIDMAQACAIEASDNVSLHFCVNASAGGDPSWMLTVNDLPVMRLTRASVKGDFAKLANENFSNSAFANKVLASVNANKMRAIDVASAIGFTGIKIPAVVDKVVTAKTKEHKYQVEAAAAARITNYRKTLASVLPVAAHGINRGFFANVTNPLKTAMSSALQKAGVVNAAKLVHKVFSEHSAAYNTLLIDRAQYLLSKAPEVRRELSAAIMGPSYTLSEDSQNIDDPNQDQGDNVDPGDLTKIDDPNQDQGTDEDDSSTESGATVDHAGLDKALQSSDLTETQQTTHRTEASTVDSVADRTRAFLKSYRRH